MDASHQHELPKNEFSLNALPSAKFDTLVCLSLNKEE